MKVTAIKESLRSQFPFLLAVPALVWQVLFLYIPLMLMIGASFFNYWQAYDGFGFTLEHYRAIFTMTHMQIILWSLLQAFIIALICLIIGYPVAYFFAVKMRRWKNLFLFFLTLPFWTNFLVQAYAWFFVLEKQGLVNTLLLKLGIIEQPLQLMYTKLSVALVMTYCYLPFMILPLHGVLEKFNITFLEASYDLGASPVRTFFKITLPLTMSGIRTGFFLVLVPAFGEYAIPAILGGGKYFYTGSLIAFYFLEARNPSLGAAFTVFSSILLLGVVYALNKLLAGPKELEAK